MRLAGVVPGPQVLMTALSPDFIYVVIAQIDQFHVILRTISWFYFCCFTYPHESGEGLF